MPGLGRIVARKKVAPRTVSRKVVSRVVGCTSYLVVPGKNLPVPRVRRVLVYGRARLVLIPRTRPGLRIVLSEMDFLDAAGEVAEQKVETRKTKKKTKAELLQMKKDNQKLAQEEQRRKNAKNRIQNELDRKALIETHSFAALVRSL